MCRHLQIGIQDFSFTLLNTFTLRLQGDYSSEKHRQSPEAV